MKRQVVVENCPTNIEYSSSPLPTERLYERLFAELNPVDLRQRTITHQEHDRDGEFAEGFDGSEQAGIRWVESWGKMSPAAVHHQSYGLPGLALSWRYQWYKGGHQPDTYHHQRLEITFENQTAVDHFVRIWQTVFGEPPKLLDFA